MATRKKKLPELELPSKIVETVTEYVGARALNKLDSAQRRAIMSTANNCAGEIGRILNGAYSGTADVLPASDKPR